MVSKVAVIALVAIVACPILLGYAMNLSEVTETTYTSTGSAVNVTPLLQNSVEHTTVQADIYELNTNFNIKTIGNNYSSIIPIYESITNTSTSYRLYRFDYAAGTHPTLGGSGGIPLTTWDHMYYQSNNGTSGGYLTLYYRDDNGTLINTYDRLHSVYWDSKTSELSLTTYASVGSLNLVSTNITVPSSDYKIGMTDTGGYIADGFVEQNVPNSTTTFADLSAGFHFTDDNTNIELNKNTKSFIMTINLDSITDANYTQTIDIYPDRGSYAARLQLIKTTVGGNVSWQLATNWSLSEITDLYYDPSRNNNTYQLFVEISDKVKTSATNERADVNCSLKYVGGWPTSIGVANPYLSYDFHYGVSAPIANNMYNGLKNISFTDGGSRSLTVRMDNAIIKGYELPIIADQVYDPKTFKDNPATTLNDISKYGESFTFGGNTYIVNKGNIALGTHQIPVNGLVLSSVPNSNGGYDNKIGNTIVSSTAQPSTITFNGNWSVSVSTISLEGNSYTKTEWVAGSFGWDGIDHNFLIVGLLTSFGAFIALGIYMRRTKASLWPLLIVCGGAAVLFFIML